MCVCVCVHALYFVVCLQLCVFSKSCWEGSHRRILNLSISLSSILCQDVENKVGSEWQNKPGGENVLCS